MTLKIYAVSKPCIALLSNNQTTLLLHPDKIPRELVRIFVLFLCHHNLSIRKIRKKLNKIII